MTSLTSYRRWNDVVGLLGIILGITHVLGITQLHSIFIRTILQEQKPWFWKKNGNNLITKPGLLFHGT